MSRPPSLLFYCQHSVGLGHLVRSFALCRALTECFDVTLLCGGRLPDGIEPPARVRLVPLPPLGLDTNGSFSSGDPRHSVERARRLRRELILRTFDEVRPQVVVVELFPFGRAKFAAELIPLLERARTAAHRPFVACSLRDILVTRRSNQAEFDDRARRIADRYLDAILVHSDPHLVRIEESFRPYSRLNVPVHYTGFVVPNGGVNAPPAGSREPRIVVSAGGGLVGEPLLRAAVEAHRLLPAPTRLGMRLIAGPFLPARAWESLRGRARDEEGVELVRSVADLGRELRTARASISQGGYNTTLELLGARVPALVVPYSTPEENEQSRRARRLAQMGALQVLDADRLSPEALAHRMQALLAFEPRPVSLDMDGARKSARLLLDLQSGDHHWPIRSEEARSA